MVTDAGPGHMLAYTVTDKKTAILSRFFLSMAGKTLCSTHFSICFQVLKITLPFINFIFASIKASVTPLYPLLVN